MKVVIQRVSRASVRAGDQVAFIGRGMLILAGMEHQDTEAVCQWMASKVQGLRIFGDAEGKMNLSLEEAGGEILVVSQFTLAGSVARGRRPSFDGAMRPEAARKLFEFFVECLKKSSSQVQVGFFQEMMEVELVNEGPVTFIVEKQGWACGREPCAHSVS